MVSEPIFRDDKQYLPLQAADLYAWQMRYFLQKGIKSDQPANEIARRLAPLQQFSKVVTPEELSGLRPWTAAGSRRPLV
jgi:hypothetical protein